MKRILYTLIFACLLLGMTGCSHDSADSTDVSADGKLKIVAAGYAEYDWICQILGTEAANADVQMLLDDGVELHSFQPSVEDMVAISEADLFVYVSAKEDSWVEEALKNTHNKNQIALNLVDVLGEAVKQEELLEGMEHDHEDHAEGEDHAEQVDEHVWLSLKNAAVLCEEISKSLQTLDPESAASYEEQGNKYAEQLRELDRKYQQVVENGQYHTLIFCDRFPFRYLLDDYGIEYYAAFSGCSTDTEASFETIAFLAEKVNEIGTTHVIMMEGSKEDLADTVLENAGTKAEILTMNSMQSVTSQQAEKISYMEIMEENLKVLEAALS